MKSLKTATLFLGLLVALSSCDKSQMGYSFTDYSKENHVVIFYAAAANDISYLIRENINTIKSGELPQTESKKVLLVFSHLKTGNPAYLERLSRNMYGELESDTLLTIDAGQSALDKDVMRTVLTTAYNAFPESKYSLILSSHGTGWLPSGYYSHPDLNWGDFLVMNSVKPAPVSTPQDATLLTPLDFSFPQYGPITKTFGMESSNMGKALEMEISHLAEAIPMHLSSLILDACLLGGVEVAYELRHLADKICFSAAEVPGKGFDYNVISSHLLEDGGSPEAFGKAFYDRWAYDFNYGATIATVVTSELDALAELCRSLFKKYRYTIYTLSADNVQGFYRNNRHFFFDLQDILVKAGITEAEKQALQEALDACISQKEASPHFMFDWGGFTIDTYCGLTMYLPTDSIRNNYLDNFYKTLAWNKATELVVE